MKLCTLLLWSAAAMPPLFAQSPETDYKQLQKWQFAAPIKLTQPVAITRDTATWTLLSGTVRLMEPVGGRVTGLVFEGEGRFTMTVPDRVELTQLRRFASRPDLQSIDTRFHEMLLRTSDDAIDRAFPAGSLGPFSSSSIATNRQNHWLIDLRSDVDAAIVEGIANQSLAMTAAIKTADFGWLTYDYDWSRPEEVQLIRWFRDFAETWLSLDPVPTDARPVRLDHIDVRADLTRYAFAPSAGVTHQRKINGHYVVEETITPLRDGIRALSPQLHATAHDVTARDEKGNALVVIHDHIGARSASVDNKFYDPLVTVFFPETLTKDRPVKITFEYDLETENYALGRWWYPTFPESFDPHTARLELLVNKRSEVRSMGELQSETETERGKRTVWIIAKPTVMITFSTAEHLAETSVEVAGVPRVTSFGEVAHLNAGTRLRNAAEDVANAIAFYQELLDDRLETPHLFVTSITGEHGQAFDGFLHLSERSYANEPGEEELFRAHETAHQWFGLKIRWKSYRDQWLTESFAEYLAMMFVEAKVKNGPRLFNEILNSYDGILHGNMAGGFSKFARPALVNALRNSSFRERLGPIGIGYRAGTGDIPFGYQLQAYYKGPLVLHMLRMLLRYRTGGPAARMAAFRADDALFIKVLRDFVHQYSGQSASTADFQRVLERDAGGDWSWFFRSWIERAEIPTLTWSWRDHAIHVRRSGVADDFEVVAPVRLDLEDGRSTMLLLSIKSAEQSVQDALPAKPRAVVFAPEHSLLAKVKRN